MENNAISSQINVEQQQVTTPACKSGKIRKWREIETLKARQSLAKELKRIDPSFELSVDDFF